MNLKLLIEEILDATGKPYAAVVDSRKNLPSSESGFCLHNPLIKPFVFDNEVNMAILVSFVFYTVAKKWMDVKFRFDSFLQWVMVTDKKSQKNPLTTEWKYGKDNYFANEKTPRLHSGAGNFFIKSLWNNKKMIYDKIIAIYDPRTSPKLSDSEYLKKALEIWYVLINNIPGLGPTKAAFCVQLMMGKLGCIDSINSAVYQAVAPDDLFTKKEKDGEVDLKMKQASKDSVTKELTNAGHKVAKAYVDFLNYLEKSAGMDISKNLWDVWCDIVAQKLNFAGGKIERSPIGITLPDGSMSQVIPYQKDEKSRELINKYVSMLGGKVDAKDVSRDHTDIITKSRERIGESFKDFVKESCWKNYKQEGMKKKGSKMVPNCVPKKKKKKK